MKHLSGENFASIADFIYHPGADIPESGIIFCHVNYVKAAFEAMHKKQGPLVLISSQGDFSTVQHYLDAMPPTLVKWFSVGAVAYYGRTHGIPLGIGDSHYNSLPFDHGQWHVLDAEMKTQRDIRNLLHVRMCLTTSQERQAAYDVIKDKSWADASVYDQFANRPLPFKDYLAEMHQYKFTLAPRGGGVDTHRLWEALYLGVIPITRRNQTLSWFESLPVCWIDDWQEVTKEMLDSEYDKIKAEKFDMSMLWLPYWEKLIREALK